MRLKIVVLHIAARFVSLFGYQMGIAWDCRERAKDGWMVRQSIHPPYVFIRKA